MWDTDRVLPGMLNHLSPFTGHGDTWRTSFSLCSMVIRCDGFHSKGEIIWFQMIDRWKGQMGIHFNVHECMGFTTSVPLFVSPLRMWSKLHTIMWFYGQGHMYFHSRSSEELASVYNTGHMTGCIPVSKKGLTVPFNCFNFLREQVSCPLPCLSIFSDNSF